MRTLVSRSLVALSLMLALVAGPLATSGCSKKSNDSAEKQDLPPLHFDGQTPNLMLTWIDKHGGTHVEKSPEKVPAEEQAFVRVLISDSEDGTRDPIYVTDLSKPESDGRYLARSMPRSAWEDEITRRRRDADPELAAAEPRREPREPRPRREPRLPPPEMAPGSAAPKAPETPFKANPQFASIVVIVYGAEWCGPCHEAREHLHKKGVKSVYKDIDRDSAARSEMKLKLDKVGKNTRSIPVIDVAGQILVGYSAGALDRALSQALGTAL
jgi:glutaredoxin